MTFQVNDEVVIGDLTDVQGPSGAVPPASGVLFSIDNAKIDVIEDKDDGTVKFKKLGLQLRLTDGIPVGGEMKYAGKVLFAQPWIWANPELYTKDYFKSNKYLFDLKLLLKALGYELTDVRINDDFLTEIKGRQLKANIKVVKKQAKDSSTGQWVDTDEDNNEVYGWKAA